MTWKYFTSLQEAVGVFENFTINIANVAKDMANTEEVKTLRKSIFEVAEAVENFALNYGKQHLSGMRRQNDVFGKDPLLPWLFDNHF